MRRGILEGCDARIIRERVVRALAQQDLDDLRTARVRFATSIAAFRSCASRTAAATATVEWHAGKAQAHGQTQRCRVARPHPVREVPVAAPVYARTASDEQ